ncbi:TIGR04197 family type VII secretion effector [Enterococcus wangshanyuanii]|uniref:Type VII secretion protein n=1 Tax=Enterococcus wangshanyuanii TaxID=2005703 RepID=A0ABQ1NKU8_9ENTE|nr:TIGR04197 family type VII secretion effector [Enterococcus wangshanyuanii]GGC77778.1 type VII secretion protein [Enterococcus wangshanyuanii]
MSNIKSDSGVAQAIATSIASSLGSLNQGSSITKDTQTTVSGNSNAQQAITQMTTFNTSLVQAVTQASNNIRSVAAEFEAVDQKISQISTNQMLQ